MQEPSTVQNLFKRVREFEWIDPIHETIRLTPVVFDSDIEILHMPQSMHHKREFLPFLWYAFNREGTVFFQASQHVCKRIIENRGCKKILQRHFRFSA